MTLLSIRVDLGFVWVCLDQTILFYKISNVPDLP